MADSDSSVRPAFSTPGPVSPPPLSPPFPVEESEIKFSMSREQLIVEQQRDPTLISLFGGVGSGDDGGGWSPRYFLKEGVLMRIDPQDDSEVEKQVVVPQRFHQKVLKLAHDNPWSQ